MSHDPSEIIIIWRFATFANKKHLLLLRLYIFKLYLKDVFNYKPNDLAKTQINIKPLPLKWRILADKANGIRNQLNHHFLTLKNVLVKKRNHSLNVFTSVWMVNKCSLTHEVTTNHKATFVECLVHTKLKLVFTKQNNYTEKKTKFNYLNH